jgi:hypothetical protein
MQRFEATLQRISHTGRVALRRAGVVLLNAVIRREPVHSVCPHCSVDFVPELTSSRCPICGWQAADAAPQRLAPAEDRRLTAGLGFAWFAGAVVFALVAHFLYA